MRVTRDLNNKKLIISQAVGYSREIKLVDRKVLGTSYFVEITVKMSLLSFLQWNFRCIPKCSPNYYYAHTW